MDLPFGNELPELDVLIVGAGLSGLTSAVKILNKVDTLNVKIIEEGSMPGGQLSSEGNRFVQQDQSELIAFLTQLNVAVNERKESDRNESLNRCWELDRGLTSTLAKFELWRYIHMLDLRMNKFDSRYKYRTRIPTMERHICQNLFFSLSRKFMYNLVTLASGVSAKDIKYDEFMCLCSTSGGLSVLVDLYLTMPKSLLSLSCRSLLRALLEKLRHNEIQYDAKAIKVQHFKNYVLVTDSTGQRHIAQAVILAIPWNKVESLEFEPQLPRHYRTIGRGKAKRQTGQITQFFLRYDHSYWITQGYSGLFLNVDPFVVGYESNSLHYSGYMLHTEEQAGTVRDTVLDVLAEQFGEEMLDPMNYKQLTCELSSTLHTPQVKPWNRVIWSSSASAANSNRNLMGGAVESGLRAAINALFVIRPQVVEWQDLSDVHERNRYAGVSTSYISGLLSRLNLYNIAYYSVFVVGLICVLSYSYNQSV
ncbi:uncharacterized protein LOC6575207 [Drosophila mojavensis]|uniref:monoamine oxidase n=1 Tax=Drosophila mojavensis TaxID=7230 RepID=B4KA09_DROMO|nr:uncharacterized protein LOC6575207 [Drosophila mojavensis]EDW16684.1 uncharacterized protein Dmoj_GI22096 [Drosophila mojavensis]